jgi:hypothetical protein
MIGNLDTISAGARQPWRPIAMTADPCHVRPTFYPVKRRGVWHCPIAISATAKDAVICGDSSRQRSSYCESNFDPFGSVCFHNREGGGQ